MVGMGYPMNQIGRGIQFSFSLIWETTEDIILPQESVKVPNQAITHKYKLVTVYLQIIKSVERQTKIYHNGGGERLPP